MQPRAGPLIGIAGSATAGDARVEPALDASVVDQRGSLEGGPPLGGPGCDRSGWASRCLRAFVDARFMGVSAFLTTADGTNESAAIGDPQLRHVDD